MTSVLGLDKKLSLFISGYVKHIFEVPSINLPQDTISVIKSWLLTTPTINCNSYLSNFRNVVSNSSKTKHIFQVSIPNYSMQWISPISRYKVGCIGFDSKHSDKYYTFIINPNKKTYKKKIKTAGWGNTVFDTECDCISFIECKLAHSLCTLYKIYAIDDNNQSVIETEWTIYQTPNELKHIGHFNEDGIKNFFRPLNIINIHTWLNTIYDNNGLNDLNNVFYWKILFFYAVYIKRYEEPYELTVKDLVDGLNPSFSSDKITKLQKKLLRIIRSNM